MSNNDTVITIDGKPFIYLNPHEKILMCIKQSLREKGKFYWGEKATWKRAKQHTNKNFGSYCNECEMVLEDMTKGAIYGLSPFNMFGKESNPFKAESLVKFLLPVETTYPTTISQDDSEWKLAQTIAFHVVYKTNSPYKDDSTGKESFGVGIEHDFRIVSSWWYRKKVMVKTVYLNVYETTAKSRLPFTFKGTFDDTEKIIIVDESSVKK